MEDEKKKKILGLSLFGILKNEEPWKKAHEIGMKELSEKANMPELLEEIESTDYFSKVKEALKRIDEYKDLSEDERVAKRRNEYFKRVFNIIQENKEEYINKNFIEFLAKLKQKYKLILITTNTEDFVNKVLDLADSKQLFDFVVTLKAEESDDKKVAFEKAINNYQKPDLFIGSQKSGKVCEEFDIKFIEYETLDKLKEELE